MSLRGPERTRINQAFRQIRKEGGATMRGKCCQSCSWAALGERSYTMAAIFHIRGEEAFDPWDKKRLRSTLHIYHGGKSQRVYEILNEAGLRVFWDGNPDEAIQVLPDLRNDNGGPS